MTDGYDPGVRPATALPIHGVHEPAGGAAAVAVRGLGFGIATGVAIGSLVGTVIVPLFGTILGGFVGGVVGIPAGLLHGLAMTLPATTGWRRGSVRLYSAAYAGAIGAAITGAWAAEARPGALLTCLVVTGIGCASGLAGLLDGPAIADGRRSSTWRRGAGAALLIFTAWGAALGAVIAGLVTLLPVGPSGDEVLGILILLCGGGAVGGLVLGIVCVGLSFTAPVATGRLR